MIKSEIINKYKAEDISQHGKNTLGYVGIALNFSYPNIDSIESAFYNLIFEEFPIRTIRPTKEHSILISNETTGSNKFAFEEKDINDYIYVHKENKYQLILNDFTLDLRCEDPFNNYTTFEDFGKIFIEMYGFLKKAAFTISQNSIVKNRALFVRKINKIEYNNESLNLLNEDYTKEYNLFDDIADCRNTSVYKEISSKETDGSQIIIRLGTMLQIDKKYLMYDFQVFKDNPINLSDNIESDLNDFSTKIYNLYCYMLGDKFITKVK